MCQDNRYNYQTIRGDATLTRHGNKLDKVKSTAEIGHRPLTNGRDERRGERIV